MAIVIRHFLAASVLRVEILPQGRTGVPFLNWRVAPRPIVDRPAPVEAFCGAGLYGVCFDDRLIYIGSFLGSGKQRAAGVRGATLAGDIVAGRWWQHFGSMTGRSHVLHVSPGTLNALAGDFGAAHPLVAALQEAGPGLAVDAGCLGTLNRLRFAAAHFTEFGGADIHPEQILRRFSYVYARVDELPQGVDAPELSRHIKWIEGELIRRYHPAVNGACRSPLGIPVVLGCDAAKDAIGQALADALFGGGLERVTAEPARACTMRSRYPTERRDVEVI
jgi:hypothetical protein